MRATDFSSGGGQLLPVSALMCFARPRASLRISSKKLWGVCRYWLAALGARMGCHQSHRGLHQGALSRRVRVHLRQAFRAEDHVRT